MVRGIFFQMFHTKELKAATKVESICDYRQMMEKKKKNQLTAMKKINKLDQKIAERQKT